MPGASIQHKHYDVDNKEVTGREHKITGTRYHADGFLKPDDCKSNLPFAIGKAGVAIEFHGFEWHGNPDPKYHNEQNFRGARYGDLYEQTMDRMYTVQSQGYTVLYIWEPDFKEFQRGASSRSLLSFCHVLGDKPTCNDKEDVEMFANTHDSESCSSSSSSSSSSSNSYSS